MTPKDIFETQIKARLDDFKDIGATYQFNVTGDGGGHWVVDLVNGTVEQGTKEADCTIELSAENLVGMVTKQVQGPVLFMTGQLKIEGNMGLAMKLGEILG